MLDSALTEGNNLGSAWKGVLACVSQLELAQMVGTSSTRAKGESLETSTQAIDVRVDKIFTRSKKLKGTAIVDFVKALCHVSMEVSHTAASNCSLHRRNS